MHYTTPPEKGNRGLLDLVAKAVGITIVAFILSYFLTVPFSTSTSALFSTVENKDFEFSDLYVQVADRRPVRRLEDRLVIVDIGNSNREEIAEILEIISLCDPHQVALDINFEIPGEDDSRLLCALSSIPNLVLPLGVEKKTSGFVISDKPFFYGQLPGVKYGVVNFPTKGEKTAVREFAIDFPMADGKTLPSLASAVAADIDPEGVELMKNKNNGKETGIISYPSREIPVINYSELADRAEELIGKSVLVGSMTEAGDIYRTPLHSNVPGLMIHACAASTIIDRVYLSKLPDYVDKLIAAVVCFIIIFLSLVLKSKLRGAVIRFLQVLFVFLTVRIGYEMYVDHDTICNFSQTLLMVAFGLFAIDIWNGGEYVYDKVSKKIEVIKKHNKLNWKCEKLY